PPRLLPPLPPFPTRRSSDLGSMGAYIRSLQRLTERSDELYFPGHGGQVGEPQRLVKAYLLHRRMREQSILECIRGGNDTVRTIVDRKSTRLNSSHQIISYAV